MNEIKQKQSHSSYSYYYSLQIFIASAPITYLIEKLRYEWFLFPVCDYWAE